jgi:hypothetical protein
VGRCCPGTRSVEMRNGAIASLWSLASDCGPHSGQLRKIHTHFHAVIAAPIAQSTPTTSEGDGPTFGAWSSVDLPLLCTLHSYGTTGAEYTRTHAALR